MLKQSIKYTNFEDREVTEEHYFHLSKADLVEMEVSRPGGLQAHLERVIQSEDGKEIIAAFKELIHKSYGVRKDGRFIKNKDLADEFMASEAYSELFMRLITNTDEAIKFVNGIIPKGLDADAARLAASAPTAAAGHPSDTAAQPAPPALEETPALEKVGNALSEESTPEIEKTLAAVIEEATPENPATLTPAQVAEMDSDEFKSGIATGKYKLA